MDPWGPDPWGPLDWTPLSPRSEEQSDEEPDQLGPRSDESIDDFDEGPTPAEPIAPTTPPHLVRRTGLGRKLAILDTCEQVIREHLEATERALMAREDSRGP